jgi:hypothetical protein
VSGKSWWVGVDEVLLRPLLLLLPLLLCYADGRGVYIALDPRLRLACLLCVWTCGRWAARYRLWRKAE